MIIVHTLTLRLTWNRIADDTQIKGFVLSIVQDHIQPNLLFLGTDVGLYVSFDKGKKWHHWTKGFPHVQVNDMKIHKVEDDLILGTFGRSFWILDDILPLREIAQKGEKILEQDFNVFPSTAGYLISYRSYDGVRFSGQAEFKGDNKSYDKVAFNVWKKPNPDKTKTKDGDDKGPKAKITIFDSENNKIRSISRKVVDGLNRLNWGLEADGIRYFSRTEPKEDDDLPGGDDVLPGKYNVVIDLEGKKDSIIAEVKADPKAPYTAKDLSDIKKATVEQNDLVEKARKSFDQLMDAKKSIAIVEKLLENQPDSTKKSFKELHKKLNGQLDTLINLFVGPENVKGIQRNPDQLSSVLYSAQNYIKSSWTAPKSNALFALEKAKSVTDSCVAKVNLFIKGDWSEYRQKANALQVKIFKE
jgi:hypothetical protein